MLLQEGQDLVIRCPETPPYILVVQHLHLEAEVLLHVLQDHDQEGQLDPKRLVGVSRTRNIGGCDIGAGYLQHCGFDVWIRDSLNMPIVHCRSQTNHSQPEQICKFVQVKCIFAGWSVFRFACV